MNERPIRILLVEDSVADADLVRDMLARERSLEVELEHVERLAVATERLARDDEPIDAVLLDFHLPDAVGAATYEGIREVAPDVPIVILTNLDDEETAITALREGVQDYLVKRTVEAPLLARTIRYAIERERAERALRISEERLALAAAGANDGLWDWNVLSGEVYYSSRWREMVHGGEAIRPTIDEWFDRLHPDDAGGFFGALEAHLGGDDDHFEHEHRVRAPDGEHRWVLARGYTVRGPDGAANRVAGSLTDVTLRRQHEEQLLHDALHDTLTGLPNRSLFVDRLQVALAAADRRPGFSFAVLFFDLDRFKNINDSLGHAVGDELLKRLARRLTAALRPGDTLARMGGDEFAVLLNDLESPSDATLVADRIQSLLSRSETIAGHDVYASASIGIALSGTGYERPGEMLRDADIAMYRAKAAGKACCEIFDRDMHRAAVALLRMETDLRRAVDDEQFVMHYQPIIDLGEGRITGFEALVRWNHPTRGRLTPEQFMAVAEETGLIVPLGWWVIAEAARQIKSWQAMFPQDPPLSVSANVSAKLFMQADLVDRVVGLVEEVGLDPSSLRLEVTETVIMDHGDAALEKLAELRALGLQLHMDDFGTGYSSLSYLQRFRYDTLKIDRTFVRDLGQLGEGGAIVQAIVALAAMLQMNVIAEGVETEDQLRLLRRLHCPQAQGFWFARPMEPRRVESLLHERPDWRDRP